MEPTAPTSPVQQSAEEFWDNVRAHADRPAPEFWDHLYQHNTWGADAPVNRYLISEAEGLAPGSALDLGCGEGGDAIWLAQHDWTVLAVDISAVALDRARSNAARADVDDRITFEKYYLSREFPAGTFDLVSAQFLHSPVAKPDERELILRRAVDAVAPGGHLLVVSHAGMPTWMTEPPLDLTLPTREQTRDALGIADQGWETVRDALVATSLPGPDGQPGTRDDHILHLRRRT